MNVIDTAPWYGNGKSEEMLGKALQGIPRQVTASFQLLLTEQSTDWCFRSTTCEQAYYLHTKVGRYEPDIERMFDFTAERVIRSVEESLARLRLDYIDCIQALIRELLVHIAHLWQDLSDHQPVRARTLRCTTSNSRQTST